ncbi:MAG: type IV pili methyl-accepting chemotaxis transducer N-terminal domain-containing protein [Gammaproteobacteria bacterium]|nr:type IV pili methyl-accepting chemotaxis transducer N-terminal domain-containing protein [Gammaproteobacteria bacterium]MBU1408846.1 type IV pili methyl-accepting chemotaxis transducer N-terminal domain-containing protein [Gammaproteobacteria bacterium]MBU1532683.1 type IV pili methyl-accepting chemotaxis transducer N-terminal domain-containing protein [Gammaproteobacteria bacterium]
MFVAITVLAVASMSTSWMVAETTQGSGQAINLAGSLRMQSWRMASIYQRLLQDGTPAHRETLQQAISRFESDLKAGPILAVLPDDETAPLRQVYRQVESSWRSRIKPGLLDLPAATDTAVLDQIPAFVARINDLVKQIEDAAEAKIMVMRIILGASVIATLLVVILSIYLVYNILVRPLRGLLGLADQIGQGNLAVRTDLAGEDEIGRLGQAFNHMAEDLSKLYQNLEARVEDKTAELTIANRSLELLYHSIARLYNGPVAPDTYAILLKDLENVLGVGHGMACLVESGEVRARVIASTLQPERGDIDTCGLMSCAECLAHQELAVHPLQDGRRVLSLPLKDTEQHYGVLQLEMPPGKELAQWQTQLLDALSRHIGIAIGTARRTEQSRRLSLLEERAALARDLHDSLAQSLAYMKIQVSRLKPLVDRADAGGEAAEVLAELREGLNSAYRQLRELLTTFRLRIEGEGLAAALQTTVTEFSDRGGIPVTLDAHLAGCTLSANEEIHALQIIREALSNVLNHARAHRAEVRVTCNSDGSVSATVTDDGIGIRQAAGTHHYGMTIMDERAKNLGGQLTVENLPTLGTRVTLHFKPGSGHDAAIPIHPAT